jgi:hypothetical protein
MADQLCRKVRVCRCRFCRREPQGEAAQEHRAINRVMATLDELGRRLFAGLLAGQAGHGGVVRLSRITGMSRTTIRRGWLEIRKAAPELRRGVRRPGAGRKRAEKNILE